MAEQRERALSETLAVIFIAILVIIATLLLIASLTGVMTKMLQTPAFIVVKVDNVSIGGGQVIRLYHQQGDAVILNGTSQSDGVSIISFSLINPSNVVFPVAGDPSYKMKKTPWRSGDTIYIYTDGTSYWVSDTISPIPPGIDKLDSGTWTVKIIDNKINGLLHALKVTIK
ncbi:MAG: hypothetical protein Q8R70_11590 [Methanoregula sp.]|nr:hypothetical protein [Methanoregula sp.]